ncbi:MAG: SDR family NAD(P)-dependent oxidoreductase [Thermonemataceae bacterium]
MKSVLVTGANAGLGFALAKQLLLHNFAVIMACRNLVKAETAKNKLIESTGNKDISILQTDLADLQSIREAVKHLKTPPEAIICNAGIANEKDIRFTKAGFEETFAVNHLGHFLLVNLLLQKYPSIQQVWMVSSSAHIPGKAFIFPPPDLSDLDALAHPSTEGIQNLRKENAKHYVNSKLCNILFAYELHRKLTAQERKVIVNAFNPGFMPENGLDRDTTLLNKWLLRYVMPLMRPLVKEMRRADTSALHLVTLLQEVSASGKYFDGLKEVPSSEESYDEQLAARLWRKSAAWVGLV